MASLIIEQPNQPDSLLQPIQPHTRPSREIIASQLRVVDLETYKSEFLDDSVHGFKLERCVPHALDAALRLGLALDVGGFGVLVGGVDFDLDVGLEALGSVVLLWEWQVRGRDHVDGQVEFVEDWMCIAGSEAGRLENVAALAREHTLIQHHALVTLLPIQCDKLDSTLPKLGGVRVAGREAEAEGVHPRQILLVVFKDGSGVDFVVFCEDLFRKGIDMVCNETGRMAGEGLWMCVAGEVVRAAVGAQPCERANHFALLRLFLFGLGGHGFEFTV